MHLEAHGSSRSGDPREAFFSDGSGADIKWVELSSELSSINHASRLSVLFIAAACYGDAAVFMFDVNSVAPFACLVCTSREIDENSLLKANVEFYRMLHNGSDLNAAVDSASRELLHSDENFRLITAPTLARRALIYVLNSARGEGVKATTERIRSRIPNEDLHALITPGRIASTTEQVLRRRWGIWFPLELQEGHGTTYEFPEDLLTAP